MIKFDFSGKRALVTGAGKGIGRALTIALSAAGAEVVAVTRTQADLDTLKTECSGPIVPICVDLSDWDATRKAVKEAGPVHFLVNNAGTGFLAPCLEATPEQFDKIMNVNVKAVMNVTQVVAKGMIERGQGGSIVMVSSQASQRAFKDHMIYCASKGALDQMTRMFALELGPHKIRVNSVNPTVVMTDLGRMAWSEPTKAKEMLSRIPMNKFASEADIVHPILYLLSDQSDMIHGSQKLALSIYYSVTLSINVSIYFSIVKPGGAVYRRPSFKHVKDPYRLFETSEADIVHPILYLLSDQSDMIHGSTLPIDGGFWAA